MDILIHASPQRMKYVTGFLVPKLNGNCITVWNDHEAKGNIRAYMKSMEHLIGGDTWHLEDDVLPDRHFNEWAERLKDFKGIVCGFGSKGGKNVLGEAEAEDMWYSFPCIRIPNDYIQGFLDWIEYGNDMDVALRMQIGKGIDFLFRKYVMSHPIPIYHHNPCMVEHIDDLIGGSLINIREEPIRAIRFEDTERLEELKHWAEEI